MKIITSHERADMDALASIYAAGLLYPDHVLVLPLNLNRNLREFLALYSGEFSFVPRDRLPRRRIQRVVLVDTQAISPLRGMHAQTSVHIIDHHPLNRPLGGNVTFEGDTVGATTTLLMEKLRERDVKFTRIGASLLLMGIYEDTGMLSFAATTWRDAQAATWLLAAGADLSIVNSFLHRPLTLEQRQVLAMLLANSVIETVQERSVCISPVTLQAHVDELASLIHPLMDVYEAEACFLLAAFQDDVQIVARSVSDAVDVAKIMREFGGGGHRRAAAARVEGISLDEVVERLKLAMRRWVEPPVRVRELMSTNVHTLPPEMSIRDAAQLMRRYGHEGFPVVNGEQLVGLLTRTDVDRAIHHRLGDAPVRSILHSRPAFVHPDAPVDQVRRIMIEHGLGQVPVVQDGRFVGIVTRTDIIKLWSPSSRVSRAQEIRRLMEEALPEGLRSLLLTARDVANDLGYSLYIVGGFVRDLLLGVPNLDLDLVVEGDAIHLAKELAKRLNARVRSHARFGTAKLILQGERPKDVPPHLDFVTARTEFYERPSVLPHVERSSIKQDLYRRDFTINTLAVCLDRDRYGELLDFYGGERDIREKRIQVLHNLSFIEDPTRILRAVRFEQRLGFTIESRTERLINDALDLLDDVSGERLRNELYLILEEAEPERCLERLDRIGVLQHLHPNLRFPREMAQRFQLLRDRFATWRLEGNAKPACAQEKAQLSGLGLCYLAILTSALSSQELQRFAERLRCTTNDARFLTEVSELRQLLPQLGTPVMLPSSIYRLLHAYSREARFVLSVLTDSKPALERLELYERKLAAVSPSIDGHVLKALGVPPGPVYREILDRVRDALLDGLVTTHDQELDLARSLARALHMGREEPLKKSG